MTQEWSYTYDIEVSEEERGHVSVSLVRRREHRSASLLRRHRETVDSVTLFARSFRPLLDSVALEAYAGRLQRITRYAQDGQFGCFVGTRQEGPNVEVVLWERWFDGTEIHTEELARRAFDAGDERSLIASTEFLADLRAWAERRNDEREASYLAARSAEVERRERESEQEAASRELNQILAAHTR